MSGAFPTWDVMRALEARLQAVVALCEEHTRGCNTELCWACKDFAAVRAAARGEGER